MLHTRYSMYTAHVPCYHLHLSRPLYVALVAPTFALVAPAFALVAPACTCYVHPRAFVAHTHAFLAHPRAFVARPRVFVAHPHSRAFIAHMLAFFNIFHCITRFLALPSFVAAIATAGGVVDI